MGGGVSSPRHSARRKKYPQSRKPLLEGASSQPLISTATPGSTAPVSVGDKRFGHFLAFAVVPVAVYIYSLFMRPNISTVLSNETGSPRHSTLFTPWRKIQYCKWPMEKTREKAPAVCETTIFKIINTYVP